MLSTKYRAARKDHCRSANAPTPYSLAPRVLLASGLALVLVACAPATVTSGNGGSGGSAKGGSGGNSNGGSGGNSNGGSGGNSGGSGGNSSGGSGGSSGGSGGNSGGSGGTVKGGSGGNSGGSGGNSGGSGGTVKGGSGGNSGGSGGTSPGGSGGTVKGGSGGNSGGSGGTSPGGSGGTSPGGSGGTSPGGSGGTSPGGAGGTSAGGGGGSGSRPPGYYYTADWNVTKVDWHGCVWTGVDCKSNCPTGVTAVPNSTTSVTPVDFTSGTPNGGPYELKGTVYNDYNSVAVLGFNINEAIDSTKGATQCVNDPATSGKDGPPTGTIPSGATGIAVNWSATTLPVTFRIQIQGVKGGVDPTNRWCATIKDTKGPSFIAFADFNTKCWDNSGTKYANEPIDAVAFLVPGTTSAKSPFDITVVGFAPGTSATDAPGPAAACGTRTGTVGQSALQGDTTKDTDASTQRAVTDGKDCKKYIVNNNNWGQEASTYQKLSFTGNSFSVDAMNGTGSSAPASFPSLYVGGNGQTLNGTFVTWDDTFPSKQPTAISAIQSAQSTFKWSGKSSGDFNASYDIWFSKSIPTAGSYNDAISGFIMLWLYKPSSRQPIGSSVRSATIAGIDWDVWAGPRGNTSTGTDPAGRPVISYVAKSSTQSFSGDLKAFFTDAVSKADTSNGITQTFSSSWYLTDVFAGFEIWSGGAGLKEDEFSIAIK